MQDLKIAYVQADLKWENPQANRSHFEALMAANHTKPDLIVLPETFTTGFPVDPRKFAEKQDGESFKWMQKQAEKHQAVITGSILLKQGNNFQNTLIWMRPDGTYETYAKRHVFRLGGEHERITPGAEQLFVQLNGWKIKPLICYDLRFPVWSKNNYHNGQFDYDLMLYVANWPAVRAEPWKQLLVARAVENLAYVLGVNRIGTDPQGIAYQGDSVLLNFKGEPISQAVAQKEMIIETTLSANQLKRFRDKFNVGLDWDSFEIR
ncbi:MAG: amidohydrolase [Bacteroidetes bacterium]|nr:amidohydrolase [Bacteroidota bacterium]MBU1580599.1 amidohydrolase [Bacteroidota bacterium]MBU2466483.1 amidohydrolase [Bacteroidota bacterium]MBU2556274.1 amidohydrolase [Bacteroidota bacterium]